MDANGACSEQVDVVIFDRQYSPFILNEKPSCVRYIPAESVYAVLEVKQNLDRQHVVYAGKKVASIRRLERTSAPVATIDGVRKRETFPILGGIITSESDWNPPLGHPFEDAVKSLEPEHQVP